MIDTPDLESAVFIRLLIDTKVIGRGIDQDDVVEGSVGDIVITRWSDAKPLVEAGRAEVI